LDYTESGVNYMSERFTLNTTDIKAWLKNAAIFVAPDLIIFLGALAAKFSAEGAFVIVLVLNLVIDLLRKYIKAR